MCYLYIIVFITKIIGAVSVKYFNAQLTFQLERYICPAILVHRSERLASQEMARCEVIEQFSLQKGAWSPFFQTIV
jgi:hypothetical protein